MGLGGLHRIVQGPSLDMLTWSFHWGEHLNYGETRMELVLFQKVAKIVSNKYIYFLELSHNERSNPGIFGLPSEFPRVRMVIADGLVVSSCGCKVSKLPYPSIICYRYFNV